MKKQWLVLSLLLILALSVTAVYAQTDVPASTAAASTAAKTPDELCSAAVPAADPASRSFDKADQVLQPDTDYRAIFCTDAGAIYVDLFEKETPVTVNNFVFLAQKGFYNNTTFHRVIEGFMAQGGDPTATGTGGPNYEFQDEIVKTLLFDQPGRLAMANAGPNTNGSQFFITVAAQPHLNGGYSLFGQVISGQANVRNIKLRDPDTATEPGTKLNTVLIITDPSTVAVKSGASATQDDVVKAMDAVDSTITPDVASILVNEKSVFTTDQVVSAAAASSQDALKKLLTDNHHQYRVSSLINNKSCDLKTVQFDSVGYTLDAFASPDDASAALADPAMAQIPLANGFTTSKSDDSLAYPVFTADVTGCDGKPAVRAMTYWQRGAFIATAEITIGADSTAVSQLGTILSQFVGQQLYEPLLSNVLFRAIE